MYRRRSFRWGLAFVGIGLAGVVAVTAATALAARSTASSFGLTVEGKASWDHFELVSSQATFASQAPFCATGTATGTVFDLELGATQRFTCDDGTGSVTVSMLGRGFAGTVRWQVVEGTGNYAGLRGRGAVETANLSSEGDPFVVGSGYTLWRSTFEGTVDWDSVAPTIAITSASATKLRRAPVQYVVRVAFSLRDDVEGNPIAYRLKVTQGRVEVASKEGTTASGLVSTTLNVLPFRGRPRSVGLYLRASDPVGNEQFLVRSLELPR